MPIEAPLLTRQRVLAAKVETSTGVAETLAAADGQLNVFEPKLTPKVDMARRQMQAGLGNLKSIPGAMSGTFSFKTELTGTGTGAGNWAAALLPACGFVADAGVGAVAGVWRPSSKAADYRTVTLGHYEDGRFRSLYGAVGKFKLAGKVGEAMLFEWEFEGVYAPPVAAAMIAPTFPTLAPPRFADSTATIDGDAYRFSTLDVEVDNTITLRQEVKPGNVAGYHSAAITERSIKVSLDPEATGYASKNWTVDWFAQAERTLSLVVGNTAGNTVTVTAPNLQVDKDESGDRDGLLTDELEFMVNMDALSIAFT